MQNGLGMSCQIYNWKNRTLVEMTRCMLKFKKISKGFWGEAITTATYILNRCPTKALVDRTPFEAYYGYKPKVNHFRIFGSVAYALIPAQHRTKLDDKSVKCIFVGYSIEGQIVGANLFVCHFT